jgi:hypothetical protein
MKTRLNELIIFPTSFTYKVIAVARSALADDICKLVKTYYGKDYLIKVKNSKSGKYCSISVTINASQIQQVETLYGKIAEVPSVKMVL